ncbi:MAG: hypothetical protein J3K34DRAFT_408619 [Monoraphidium minutum]|nr:MAG: hypothetical protein J3K34DRAFT_408619 [Monoraphidium minutum]
MRGRARRPARRGSAPRPPGAPAVFKATRAAGASAGRQGTAVAQNAWCVCLRVGGGGSEGRQPCSVAKAGRSPGGRADACRHGAPGREKHCGVRARDRQQTFRKLPPVGAYCRRHPDPDRPRRARARAAARRSRGGNGRNNNGRRIEGRARGRRPALDGQGRRPHGAAPAAGGARRARRRVTCAENTKAAG